MLNEIELPGCTPEPLMSYLKALGVFRLVAEQKDPAARLSWRFGVAVLHTTLDREELAKFFIDEYAPTPVIAPWNGGSGFYGGGSGPLVAVEQSTSERFARYRETIHLARTIIPSTKPKDDDKESVLIACRSVLADEVISWLDTCFVLGENRPTYFPLLGTGGNDGRLDFTSNFMQRVAEVIALGNAGDLSESTSLLHSSLLADTLIELGKSAVGQFNPGGIGGPNGTQGKFEADSRVNPWDYILMIEGTMLFAGAVSRRMGSSESMRSVFPFVVDSVAVGYGSSTVSEETSDGSRAEMWMPLWSSPSSYGEIKHLISQGRAQLGRNQARNAVEFALAVNLLGVDRGIDAFVRFAFLKRNGLAFLAAPLGRIEVRFRPVARLLEDPPLRSWIDRLRRACNDKEKTPTRYQAALRNLDRTYFAFACRSQIGNDSKYLLDIVRAIGIAERTLARGLSFAKEKYIRPLFGLSSQWLEQAHDGSAEFRLAASLAGIGKTKKNEVGPIRAFLEEVEVTKFVNWNSGSTSAVWSKPSLANNLAAVFKRRQMEAYRAGIEGVPIRSSYFARLDDVIDFLHGNTDDDKLADLLWGLICVEFPAEQVRLERSSLGAPLEFGLPRLLVNSRSIVASGKHWNIDREGAANAVHDPDVFHQLATGRRDAVSQCVTRAARRLKSGGLMPVGYRNRRGSGHSLDVVSRFDPTRLLASMLFPLSNDDLKQIAKTILYPIEESEASLVD